MHAQNNNSPTTNTFQYLFPGVGTAFMDTTGFSTAVASLSSGILWPYAWHFTAVVHGPSATVCRALRCEGLGVQFPSRTLCPVYLNFQVKTTAFQG